MAHVLAVGGRWSRSGLAALVLLLLLTLGGCLETRVIRDNTLDAKYSGGMSPEKIERAGQGGGGWR